jgi:hypothetical protein
VFFFLYLVQNAEQDRQCAYKVTLSCVRVTIFSVENQQVLHKLSVCPYSVLAIQHDKPVRRISLYVLPSVACLDLPYFPTYLLNGTNFGKTLLNTKCVFIFCVQPFSETFLILRRIQRNIIINVHRSSCKVTAILVAFSSDLNFLDRVSKNIQKSNFMKTHPLGVELFHADGQADGRT